MLKTKRLFLFLLYIFILFIFSFTLTNINYKDTVSAEDSIKEDDSKPIISYLDTSLSSYLFSSDVTSFTTNANFNKEDNYNAFYNLDNTTYKRSIYVRSEEELNRGISIIEEADILNLNNDDLNIRSFDSLKLNEKDTITYANYSDQYSILFLFSNNTLLDKYIMEDTYITSIITQNNKVIISANSYYTNNIRIKIMEFNLKNNKLDLSNYKEYVSNGETYSKKLFFLNNYLYLSIESKSNQGIISRSNANRIIALLKINILTFEIEENINFGNNYDNYLNNVFLINDLFYLDVNLNGTSGEIYNTLNSSYTGRMIIIINKDLKIENKISISKSYDAYDLLINSDNYYLIEGELDYKKIIVLKGNLIEDNTNLSSIILDFDTNDNISFKYILLNSNIYFYINSANSLNEVLILSLDSFEKIKDEVINDANYVVNNLNLYENNIYLSSLDQSDLYTYSYNYVVLEKEKDTLNGITYEKLKAYSNQKLLDLNYKNLIIDQDLSDIYFGTYSYNVYCYCKDFMFSYVSTYTSKVKINIMEDLTYDVGTEIEFNGEGLLNDIKINSPYIINEIGKYHLVINGVNGAKYEINFTISDLTVDSLYNPSQVELSDIDIIDTTIASKSNLKNEDIDYDFIPYEFETSDLSILMILILIIIVCTLFILFKYKQRKRLIK